MWNTSRHVVSNLQARSLVISLFSMLQCDMLRKKGYSTKIAITVIVRALTLTVHSTVLTSPQWLSFSAIDCHWLYEVWNLIFCRLRATGEGFLELNWFIVTLLQEVIMILKRATHDFESLIKRINVQTEFEKCDIENRYDDVCILCTSLRFYCSVVWCACQWFTLTMFWLFFHVKWFN